MAELKPCPMCRGPAELRPMNGGHQAKAQCRVMGCGIQTPILAPDVAAGIWNIRAALSGISEVVDALEPFARCAERAHETTEDDRLLDVFTVGSPLTVGDLRKARAALSHYREAQS